MNDIVPATGDYFDETLAEASPDLLRAMIREMAQRMMDAEVEQRCGAGYGEVSPQRTNSRNGYRTREGEPDCNGQGPVVARWLLACV